jgi:1-acyl-sn-glycerol-3-phosphate acyltransferase
MRGIDEAVATIRGGASVILFAEGTRTSDGALQPFKRGPFHLAVRAGVPVVPVTIDGSYEVLPRGSWRIRPGTIRVTLSEPLESPPPNGKNSELALRDAVHRIIANNAGRGRA